MRLGIGAWIKPKIYELVYNIFFRASELATAGSSAHKGNRRRKQQGGSPGLSVTALFYCPTPVWLGTGAKRDEIILANTYFSHNIQELSDIFCLKEKGVNDKLKELYLQDNNSWDFSRLKELEMEAIDHGINNDLQKRIPNKISKYYYKLI